MYAIDTVESSEFFQAVVDSISSTLCVIDDTSTIVYVNRAWRQFARENNGNETMLGTQYLQACSSANEDCEGDGRSVADGVRGVLSGALPEFHFEYPCHSPREQRWFLMSARPLHWTGPKHVVIKHRNITALKLAEFALIAKNEELARSNAEQDQFAYMTSHDLQEPIRSVSSMARFLAEEVGPVLSQDAIKARDFMLSSCERMQELVRGLLDYARIGQTRTPSTIHLQSLLQDIQQDLSARIHDRGARIEVADDLPSLTVYAMEVRLLLQNLLSNALKFCPANRTPHVRLSARQMAPHRWRLCISDNGIGMPVHQHEKIFMIFQRTAEGAQFEGTGIGLAHCRKIAELHGGRIWVESSSPAGSTFCVDLEEVRTVEPSHTVVQTC